MVAESAIRNFSVAILTIFAWLVPSIIDIYRAFRRTLERKQYEWQKETSLIEKNQLVSKAMQGAMMLCGVIFTASAVTISILTNELDHRTSYIIVGLSHFVGAIFIFEISFSIPKWMGVYYSIKDQRRAPIGRSLKSLSFNVRWAVYRVFFKVYFFFLPFFCGAKAATIPVSVVVGILVGLSIAYSIDLMNKKITTVCKKTFVGLSIAFLVMFLSSVLFSFGCDYVEVVWGRGIRDPNIDRIIVNIDKLGIVSFFAWFGVAIVFHVFAWLYTTARRQSGEEQIIARPHTFFGTSMYISTTNLFSNRNSIHHEQQQHQVSSKKKKTETKSATPDGGGAAKQQFPRMSSFEDVKGYNNSHTSKNNGTEKTSGIQFDESLNEEHLYDEEIPQQQQYHGEEEENRNEKEDDAEETFFTLFKLHCCYCNNKDEFYDKEKTYIQQFLTFVRWVLYILIASGMIFFVVIVIGAQAQEKIVKHYLPIVDEILYKHMNDQEVCAYDPNFSSLFSRISNTTRNGSLVLNATDNITTGDDDYVDLTSTEYKVKMTRKTFESKEIAHLNGYDVLHCGSCGKCSNWIDSRQQYTTRNILGQIALECAKSTLIGGGFDALKECTMEKTGFQEECAKCWTQDYICTKENCLFISLKGFIIDTVTNLQVTADDITPATCEEAMCEATEITGYEGFVPCSGASRRRMNVTSTIARPGDQQCAIVDVLPWSTFFGYSTGYGDISWEYSKFNEVTDEVDVIKITKDTITNEIVTTTFASPASSSQSPTTTTETLTAKKTEAAKSSNVFASNSDRI